MAVMEITTYTIPPDNADAFAAAAPGIAAAMQELAGLERVETVDLGRGRRADVAVWRDEQAHEAAMTAAADDPRLRPLFELIDDVEMRTGTIMT